MEARNDISKQTSLWQDDKSRRLVHPGCMDNSFIRHVQKMIVSHLWLGNIDSIKLYTEILNKTITEAPWLRDISNHPFSDKVKYVIRCLDAGITPIPWMPSDENWSGSIIIAGAKTEADVVQRMIGDESLLNPISLGEIVRCLVTECPTGGGRADMKFQVGTTLHVVEVKATTADHRVVGQIQKYLRDIGGKLHWGIYNEVVGWVVAPDITKQARLELKICGVKMIKLCLS